MSDSMYKIQDEINVWNLTQNAIDDWYSIPSILRKEEQIPGQLALFEVDDLFWENVSEAHRVWLNRVLVQMDTNSSDLPHK